MKLNIDFSALDKLLNDMGVKPKETPMIPMPINRNLNLEELGAKGVPGLVPIFKSDGIYAPNGEQILLYLKEVKNLKANHELQKFHLYQCRTLDSMDKQGSFDKYISTTRKDGNFLVDMPFNKKYDVLRKLDVCKNCLSLYNDKRKENDTVNTFSISEFFKLVGDSSFSKKTTYTDKSAPKSGYPDNWKEISTARKQECNYVCQECDLDLKNHTHLLQTHHVDRKPEKKDHSASNLKVLCIECHSNQIKHGHMKSSHAEQILEVQRIRVHSPNYEEN